MTWLLIVVVVALSATALLLRGLWLGYPPAQLGAGATLGRKEQALVAAVADALFPPNGPIPVSGTGAGLVAYTDEYVRGVPPPTRLLMRLLFIFVEHGPWLFGPAPRFTRLSQARRIREIERMAQSPVYLRRVAFLSIRMVMCMGYLANEDVKRAIGLEYRMAPFEDRARAHASAEASVHAGQVLA